MRQITLLEFATDNRLTILLIKERAKCRRRNRDAKKPHILDRECDLDDLSSRKMLSRLMPPRRQWVVPSKRAKLPNGAVDTCKNAEKALLLTISRDRKLRERVRRFLIWMRWMRSLPESGSGCRRMIFSWRSPG